ncbi:nucleotidyltransferase [bacterium]|nr:nucleotidyltransferase [bacterium]
MQNLHNLLKLLVHSPLDFIIVGGFAAVLHGCHQTTRDIDICILNSPEQIDHLKALLAPYHPCLRTTGESFLQTTSLEGDLHLVTDLGMLDVISSVIGVGSYYSVLKNSVEIDILDGKCRLISIDDLIKCKRELGRHRDLAVAEELEAIKQENNKKS